MNVLKVLNIDLDDIFGWYEDDKFYGAILIVSKEEEISDEMLKRKVEKLLALFHLDVTTYCMKERFVSQGKQFQ